jgi:predicted ATPase
MEHENNMFVLTGGACCGKTTLINRLKKQGFCIIDESARQILKKEKSKDFMERQKMIYTLQIENEKQFKKIKEPVFLDRGLLDIYAYCLYFEDYIPKEFSDSRLLNRYKKVFILDVVGFENDGLRIESGEKESKKIHKKIKDFYEERGYSLINVPIFDLEKENSIKQRLDYILSYVNDRN